MQTTVSMSLPRSDLHRSAICRLILICPTPFHALAIHRAAVLIIPSKTVLQRAATNKSACNILLCICIIILHFVLVVILYHMSDSMLKAVRIIYALPSLIVFLLTGSSHPACPMPPPAYLHAAQSASCLLLTSHHARLPPCPCWPVYMLSRLWAAFFWRPVACLYVDFLVPALHITSVGQPARCSACWLLSPNNILLPACTPLLPSPCYLLLLTSQCSRSTLRLSQPIGVLRSCWKLLSGDLSSLMHLCQPVYKPPGLC